MIDHMGRERLRARSRNFVIFFLGFPKSTDEPPKQKGNKLKILGAEEENRSLTIQTILC